ncbi:MAG: tail fiber domain-containing protein, partial [Bacteroidota bacterium]
VQGNIATPSGNSVYVGGVTNDGADGLRMHQTAGGSYIDHKGAGDLLFRADNTVGGTPRMTIRNNGNVGIGRNPVTNILEVEGDASKSSAGDWLANSDARLKKNIRALNSQLMLQSLLALQGIAYEWDDDKTGSKRPDGIQYGFTAQNIQEVFPTLVEEDKLGYLQTAYGTYDAMTVEAIRALHEEIEKLETENAAQQAEIERLWKVEGQLDKITAALAGAGISVEK